MSSAVYHPILFSGPPLGCSPAVLHRRLPVRILCESRLLHLLFHKKSAPELLRGRTFFSHTQLFKSNTEGTITHCTPSAAMNNQLIIKHENKAYACSTLPARRHFVQTLILLTPPTALTLTFWTLEFQILLDLLCEWLTLFPKCAPLPQTSHFAIITPPHVSNFRRQR